MKKEDLAFDNSSGVVSVVLGIISITSTLLTLFAVMAPIVGIILGITALVFGIIQFKKERKTWGKAGIILAIIGIIINLVTFIYLINITTEVINQYKTLQSSGSLQQFIQSQGQNGIPTQ